MQTVAKDAIMKLPDESVINEDFTENLQIGLPQLAKGAPM